jgi:formylglycine-generating enzyme required for sulfatase activity
MNNEDPQQPSDHWLKELEETQKAMDSRTEPGRTERPLDRWLIYLDPEQTVPLLLRYIPPTCGNFSMGGTSLHFSFSKEDWIDSDPVTQIEIPEGYWLATFPTTQKQWQAVESCIGLSKRESHFKGDYLPMENVSWDDCTRWLGALNNQERIQQQLNKLAMSLPPTQADQPTRDERKWRFELPAEAHWEWACRATPAKGNPTRWVTSMTQYHAGDGPTALARCGWYDGNANGKTHRVGEKISNALGLYDMHGNVWEWCRDAWVNDYAHLVNGMHVDQMVRSSEQVGENCQRAMRGGSWGDSARGCQAADRDGWAPVNRYWGRGFRVGLFPGPNRANASKTQVGSKLRREAETQREPTESPRAGFEL